MVTTVDAERRPVGRRHNCHHGRAQLQGGRDGDLWWRRLQQRTVVSTHQITCTTTAHFPALVDVTVTNPDAQSGTLLSGYTYLADTASLGLPEASGGQHTFVQVPVSLASVDGLAAASLTVTFSPAVLSAQSASVGNLTPGWSLAAQTDTPGEIRLSMASDGGTVSGSGELAVITFDVVGSPSITTSLHLQDILLNDGAIPVETADGTFTVEEVYSVSGAVGYWSGGAVSGTLLTLSGDRLYVAESDAAGAFAVTQVVAGDYTLTPSKSDDVNGITAYDASLALQHDAGLSTLSGHAFAAADVNRGGTVAAMDAFYMLQKAAGLIDVPFEGAGRVWDFVPQSREVTGLSTDLSGQDFTGILLGDPSGNWSPPGALMAAGATATGVLQVEDAVPDASGAVTVGLTLDPAGADVYGVDLALSYDVAAITAHTVTLGTLAEGWMSAINLTTPGEVQVALADALPLTEAGDLLVLRLQLAPGVRATTISFTRGKLNEGGVPVTLVDGRIGGQYDVFLPLVAKQLASAGTAVQTVALPLPARPRSR